MTEGVPSKPINNGPSGYEPAGYVSPRVVALYGVLTALTAAITMTIAIPFPPTRGFFNLGDAMVFFSAFVFGWRAGLICGGIGSAAADVLLGYVFFSPITLISKGTEGLVAGLASRATKNRPVALAFGVAAGGVCMVLGYFLGEWVLYGLGPALAEIPVNIVQVTVGGTVASVISYPVSNLLKRTSWGTARL
jgi:uncharacterized membrane protein